MLKNYQDTQILQSLKSKNPTIFHQKIYQKKIFISYNLTTFLRNKHLSIRITLGVYGVHTSAIKKPLLCFIILLAIKYI